MAQNDFLKTTNYLSREALLQFNESVLTSNQSLSLQIFVLERLPNHTPRMSLFCVDHCAGTEKRQEAWNKSTELVIMVAE